MPLAPDRSRDLSIVSGRPGREGGGRVAGPWCPCFTKPETSSEVAKGGVLSVRATNNPPTHTHTHVMIYKEQEKFS